VHLTQTTLSVDETVEVLAALRTRFPQIVGPAKDDICYATQNRQVAVKELVRRKAEVVLVLGSPNSSNSMRLCEVAEENGARSYLIDSVDDIQEEWVDGAQHIGVTAGASAPEHLVQEVLEWLSARSATVTEHTVIEEDVTFGLPSELTNARRSRQAAGETT
jgi:4-hydroxy-3-methylbut-2-enyl diphosphate reductase